MKTDRMTIALPTSTFLPSLGGTEIVLHNIASRLKNRGLRPVVIAPASFVRRLRQKGWTLPYEVVSLPPRMLWTLIHLPRCGFFITDNYFSWLQRRFQFDVWHATVGYPIGIAVIHFARTKRSVPHLVRCGGEDIQIQMEIGYGARCDARVNEMLRKWLPRADKMVAISEDIAENYRALGIPDERIIMIHNGISLSRFDEEIDSATVRARHGVSKTAFLFLSVGRNHPKKNFAAILQAAAALRQRTRREFAVMIVGKAARGLREYAQNLGISDQVILLDEVRGDSLGRKVTDLPPRELIEIYKAADSFVFPSFVEGWGNVIIEAMAAGLPIITSDAPGCREVVRAGRDGLLVDPHDEASLAKAMLTVMDDEKRRVELVSRARTRARQFCWRGIVDQYIRLYEELIEARRHPVVDNAGRES